MRNFRFSQSLILFCVVLLATVLTGCADQPRPRDREALIAINSDLDQKLYDQAVARSNEFLRQSPQGVSAAHALYLKGRAYEDRPASTSDESKANFQQARIAYEQALQQSPPPRLEAYVRTSLANVAYFQDDFNTALQQWTSAYDKLDRDDLKAWTLYRAGLCQQRLGRFADADRTFALVERSFAKTIPADRAREHRGLRSFYLQLATFKSASGADKAVLALRAQGVVPQRAVNPNGYTVIRLGPFPTYTEAKRQQQRFAAQYEDALIIP